MRWRGLGPDVAGKATIGADMASPAGYALQTGKPVISNHLNIEQMIPHLRARLVEHGIRRATNVILHREMALRMECWKSIADRKANWQRATSFFCKVSPTSSAWPSNGNAWRKIKARWCTVKNC